VSSIDLAADGHYYDHVHLAIIAAPERVQVNVTIKERKLTLLSEYDISAAGTNYYARKQFTFLFNKLQLRTEAGEVVAGMQSRFSFFRSKYDFQLSDGRLYHFQCENLWKNVYVCEREAECYQLYQHKGLKFSIFRNQTQIAAFTKNRIVIGNGNRYEIRMNSDADVVLVICMVLVQNTADNDHNRATITFDVGNIGPEDRPFDKFWEPTN
jgi:hypothetical protein